MRTPSTFEQLEELGRVRLSPNFFMRDFLYSEIAAWHGIRNIPDHPDVAIRVGRRLCEELLEPLQATFGRVEIRSGYRAPAVNEFGNRNHLNCASNESNFAAHIWDYPDASGRHGAMACIVVPWLCDHVDNGGRWMDMAWWIHDHLPYSKLCFFTKLAAFNIGWHERPERRIDSFAEPKGCLTRPGSANHTGSHAEQYSSFPRIRERELRTPTGIRSTEVAGAQRLALPAEGCLPCAPVDGLARPSHPATVRPAVAPVAASEEGQDDLSGRVHYRAVHEKTLWRKVDRHRSVAAALNGKDGAAALFARKVRISYETHGEPRFVMIWQDGTSTGWIVRMDPARSDLIVKVRVPTHALMAFERRGSAPDSEIEALCAAAQQR